MTELVHSKAEKYADDFTTADGDLLLEVADHTIKNHSMPHMLSGHVQGRLLSMLSCLVKPERILEIGTFTGYSALCLAEGLQDKGVLHTIDIRDEGAAVFFDRSAFKNKIVLHIGDANKIIPELTESWDIVFIDADKTGYLNYYELILPQLKINGLIIVDNVLFHGDVLEDNITGKNAKAIHAFNEHIKNDKRVEQVLLTVRDGLLLLRKI
ncbi:O-methyltransferase [Ferruginibacter sp. SUN002]|uniref:O-methyltransferase n=1 Tax=Ferruginibacter sp. SUN002 TaxID=2937789 RepID=UPI003D35C14E